MSLDLHRAHGLLWQAQPLIRAGRVVEAERLAQTALGLFREHGDPRGETEAVLAIAAIEAATAREYEALVHYEEARRLAGDDVRQRLAALLGLATAAVDLAELDTASGYVEEAEGLLHDVPERNASLSLVRASLHHHAGQLDLAAGFASYARAVAQRGGDEAQGVAAWVRAGLVALDAGDDAGLPALDAAAEAAEHLAAPSVRAGAETALALGLLAVGDPVEAMSRADRARRLAGAAGDARMVARALAVQAVGAVRRGLYEGAARAVDEARPVAEGHPVRSAEVDLAEGHLFRVRGRRSARHALEVTAPLVPRSAGVRRFARWLRVALGEPLA